MVRKIFIFFGFDVTLLETLQRIVLSFDQKEIVGCQSIKIPKDDSNGFHNIQIKINKIME